MGLSLVQKPRTNTHLLATGEVIRLYMYRGFDRQTSQGSGHPNHTRDIMCQFQNVKSQ
jgi:hypothetical protein